LGAPRHSPLLKAHAHAAIAAPHKWALGDIVSQISQSAVLANAHRSVALASSAGGEFSEKIQPDVTFPQTSNTGKDEIYRRMARNLESRGALWIENVGGGIRVEYELDLLYFLLWTSTVAIFPCIVGLIALSMQGNVLLSTIFGVFFSVSIPVDHAFTFGEQSPSLRTRPYQTSTCEGNHHFRFVP
jgi:hypothetical protein